MDSQHNLQAPRHSNISSTGEVDFAHPPLANCPKCAIEVVVRRSNTDADPDRLFYFCKNQKKRSANCRFWMWEEEYEEFLQSIGRIDPNRSGNSAQSRGIPPSRGDFDNLMRANREMVELLQEMLEQSEKKNTRQLSVLETVKLLLIMLVLFFFSILLK